LEEQQRHTAALRRSVAECTEELKVLRCCLSEAGVLRQTAFSVELQRRRFESVRAAHPLVIEASWEDALSLGSIALDVGLFSGPSAARATGATSQTVSGGLAKVWPEIHARWPRSIFVCGGHDGMQPLNSVERFDLQSGTWEVLPPMAQRRSGSSAGVAQGRLFVCGGFNGQVTLGSAECFDPGNNSWATVCPMSVARVDAAAGVAAGELFVCGGLDDLGQPLSSAERLDPATGVWDPLPAMLQRRCKAAAGVLHGHLYLCGGRDHEQSLSSVEQLRLSPTSTQQLWWHGPAMPDKRSSATAAVASGKLYVCGGNVGRQSLQQVDCFDPFVGLWEVVAPMGIGRRFCAAAGSFASSSDEATAAGGGGWLCVFGGNGAGQSLSSAERFDTVTGRWLPLPPMRWARDDAAAATGLS